MGLVLGSCGAPAIYATRLPPDRESEDAYGLSSQVCQAACSELQRLGCTEGAEPDCAVTLDRVSAGRIVRMRTGETFTCDRWLHYTHSYSDTETLGIACTMAPSDGGP